MAINRQWILASRPAGMVSEANFQYREVQLPRPADGEFLVRVLYVSFDPAMRAFLNARPGYASPQPVGDVMRASAIGQVVESQAPDFHPGDLIVGNFGWQDYAVSSGLGPYPPMKVPSTHPPPAYLGVLGGTGLTAYFGMLEVGKPQAGETVVVSGAAGATGSIAAQIAKLQGARVIGIAGGATKCGWLTGELKLDAAIDYRTERVAERLRELCPDGIHVYFDNVGGEILEIAIDQMATWGRIALCGMISSYNAAEPPPGPRNLFTLIARRVRMEGFLILDYAPRFSAARRELSAWLAQGKLKAREDLQEGFENIPRTFLRLFSGENIGKQLLKIADPAPQG